MNEIKAYRHLAKNLAQLVSLSKLYRSDHPIIIDKIKEVYLETDGFLASAKRSLVLARTADIFFINGEKMDADDKLTKKFIEDFVDLQLGSIELEPGLTEREFGAFAHIICQKEGMTGTNAIKKFLSDENVSHVIAHAATFKLVRDDENIIKKGTFVRTEDLPAAIIEKFSNDLVRGRVGENLKAEGPDYKAAAHSPVFLAALAENLVRAKEAPHDPEKILWLLADYLIDEISTGREEEINRKVLENVKDSLLLSLQEVPGKKHMAENVEKAYAAINAALQLKGLLTLYRKHRKELESTAGKIKKILETLPKESRLYQNTMRDLADPGAPAGSIFPEHPEKQHRDDDQDD